MAETIIIDVSTREITVPDSEKDFGVAGDKWVETKRIRINGHITDNGIDLTDGFVWRIVAQNGLGTPCDDPIDRTSITADGCIDMDWTPSPSMLAGKGALRFAVCGVKVDAAGVAVNEWHSEIGTGKVKESVETAVEDIGGVDLVAHLQAMSVQVSINAKAVAGNTADVKNAAEQVEQGKQTALTAVESIVDSAKQSSDAAATAIAARDAAKNSQNAATQQATQAAQSKDAATRLTEQAKKYAEEAAGYAGAAKYAFGYDTDGRFAFFVNE